MKMICFIVGLLTATSTAFGQGYSYWNRCGDFFDQKKYPADTFEVKRMAYQLKSTQVVLTVLHHRFLKEEMEDQVWLEQSVKGNVIRGKYLGSITSGESGVAVPVNQPFSKYFIVYDAGEFTGTFYLLTESGEWFHLPGGELVMNAGKTMLYTTTPAECGKCRVGKFDLKTQELVTKWSEGSEQSWPEVAGKENTVWWVKDEEWVRW